MELKKLEKKEVTLNTKQELELVNVINKLGLKEQLKAIMFGNGEIGAAKKAYLVKEEQYRTLVIDLVENKMDYEEYEHLEQEEKNQILNEVLTDDAIKMGNELNKMENELAELNKQEAFDLFYTAIIERLYSNQDVVFKALAEIYEVKPKEIANQELTVTGLMIKKIMECKEIESFMKVFL